MKNLILTISFLPLTAFAGNGGVSGGDPKAIEFIQVGKHVCRWFASSPTYMSFHSECEKSVAELEASLNDPQRTPQLVFTNREVIDSNSVPKSAVVDMSTRTVNVNNIRWIEHNFTERATLVAMELALLSGIPERYRVGGDIFEDMTALTRRWSLLLFLNLPNGTKLIPTANFEFPARSNAIYFGEGEIKHIGSQLADTIPRINDFEYLKISTGCRVSYEDMPVARSISEVVFKSENRDTFLYSVGRDRKGNTVGGMKKVFSFWSGDGIAGKSTSFSCWKDNFQSLPTIRDFLNSIGSYFFVVLPNPTPISEVQRLK